MSGTLVGTAVGRDDWGVAWEATTPPPPLLEAVGALFGPLGWEGGAWQGRWRWRREERGALLRVTEIIDLGIVRYEDEPHVLAFHELSVGQRLGHPVFALFPQHLAVPLVPPPVPGEFAVELLAQVEAVRAEACARAAWLLTYGLTPYHALHAGPGWTEELSANWCRTWRRGEERLNVRIYPDDRPAIDDGAVIECSWWPEVGGIDERIPILGDGAAAFAAAQAFLLAEHVAPEGEAEAS